VKQFKKQLENFGIKLTDVQLQNFGKYKDLLLKWNQAINLISKNDESRIETHHFIDSLAACPYIKNSHIGIDIGSGAGFPGIPLKICQPQIHFFLVESKRKKGSFLNTLIQNLNLSDITVITERAEEINMLEEFNEKFDFATARAVTNLAKLIELCLPFLKKNAILYAYKGGDVMKEMELAKQALDKSNGKILEVLSYRNPQVEKDRKLILVQKG
jgi:16S rRNA (guanine527-N7)-methyltransferase